MLLPHDPAGAPRRGRRVPRLRRRRVPPRRDDPGRRRARPRPGQRRAHATTHLHELPLRRGALHRRRRRQPGVDAADFLRLGYGSFVTPSTVYDYDVRTGELALRKQQPVLGEFDPALFEQRREWATAPDGTRIPISLVYRTRPGHARRARAARALRLRLVRGEHGPVLRHRAPQPARPRRRLRDRARARRRRAGPALVRERQEAAQEEHVHRLRRGRPPPRRPGLDRTVAPGRPGRQRGRPAHGRGREPRAERLRRHPGGGAVRRPADHHPRPVAAADGDRVGRVGRPAARPGGVRLHEVVLAARERARTRTTRASSRSRA